MQVTENRSKARGVAAYKRTRWLNCVCSSRRAPAPAADFEPAGTAQQGNQAPYSCRNPLSERGGFAAAGQCSVNGDQ